MAVVDDLVSAGFSRTQSDAVIGVDAGTATANDLVTQGVWANTASVLVAKNAGTATDDNLVQAGLSTPQVTAVDAAFAVTP